MTIDSFQEPPKEMSPSEALVAAAVALKIMRTGGYAVPFQDWNDTAQVWADRLKPIDAESLEETAKQWAATQDEWPTLSQFETLARSTQRHRKAVRAGLENRMPAQICPECSDSTWVDVDPDGIGPSAVRPCSICTPDRYSWWKGGHLDPGHSTDSCRHDLCQPSIRGRRSKR